MPCILFIVCSQHNTICFNGQAAGRSKAAFVFVSPPYPIKIEMCYLTLGIWGSLEAFLPTALSKHYLLICGTLFYSFLAVCPSLAVCEYVACDPSYEFLFTPSLNSVVITMSGLWFAATALSLPAKVPGTYSHLHFLFPVFSLIPPSLADASDKGQRS